MIGREANAEEEGKYGDANAKEEGNYGNTNAEEDGEYGYDPNYQQLFQDE